LITSTANAYVKLIKSLAAHKGRVEHGLFLAEGAKLVSEAMDAGVTLHSVAFSSDAPPALDALRARAEAAGVPVYDLDARVFSAASDAVTPQGVLAAVRIPDPGAPGPAALPDIIVALERVQDPGNMGAIIRTADAAGAGAMLLSPGCCEPFSPKAVRGAMGSAFRLPLYRAEDFTGLLRRCADSGYAILAGVLDGENVFAAKDLPDKFVLMIGNESGGLSEAALACATRRLRVPMAGGAESLNAGVAAGVLLYALMQGRLAGL
jgi:TrmH family RNA methyltransferase